MDERVYALREVAKMVEATAPYGVAWSATLARIRRATPPTADQLAYVRALAAHNAATVEATRRKALAWIDALAAIMDPADCDQAVYNVVYHLFNPDGSHTT